MRSFSLVLAVFVVSGVVLGFGYNDSFTNGTPIPGITARTASIGGLKAQPTMTPAGLFMNPAELGLLHDHTLSLDSGMLRWTETVFDMVGANRGGQILGTATGAFATRTGPVVIGAGLAKVADFDYAGTHNTFNPYSGNLDSVEVAYVSGSQWEYLAGASLGVFRGVFGGVSAGIRTMKAEYDYFLSDKTFGGTDSTAQWTVSGSEFCWHAGLVTASDLASAGISYSSGSEHYYPSLAFGGSIVSPHINNTRTGFEAEIVRPFFRNDFTGKLFIESPLTEQFDIRTAVTFNESYQSSRTSLGFSLGGGYRFGDDLDVSVGCLLNSRSRSAGAFAGEDADKIEDATISLVAGAVYAI
jgi:hypothetical protein